MELNGITGRLFRISEIISRMAYVNLLWIFFTILGLGVFGFMPATVGLFAVVRKWVMGDADVPVFSTFWNNYKREFLKSNLLGVILFMMGYILYVDFAFLPAGGYFTFIRSALVAITVLYGIILLFIFPVYVQYEWKWKISLYLKYSLVLGLGHPFFLLLMGGGIGALYFVSYKIPGIIPFFSVSILAYIIMWPAYTIIKKIEDTQVEEEEEKPEIIGEIIEH